MTSQGERTLQACSMAEGEETGDFSDSASELSLSCTRSLFDNECSKAELDDDDGIINPYQFEPLGSSSDDGSISDESDSHDQRRHTREWLAIDAGTLVTHRFKLFHRCTCGHCQIMPSNAECLCCREIDKVVNKLEESEGTVSCITEHEGFEPVCLNVWVLQAAYFQYRQHYGTDALHHPINEWVIRLKISCILCEVLFVFIRRYRFIAYRQLTRWCWGWLGSKVQVILPSCAVLKIRESFPSETYTGFHYPHT